MEDLAAKAAGDAARDCFNRARGNRLVWHAAEKRRNRWASALDGMSRTLRARASQA